MYPVLALFLLVHAVCVLPGIKPSNSYGMMLDGFPVKDFLDIKYIIYLLLCTLIELIYGQAHLFLGLSILSFVFFACVGGWLSYYCFRLLIVPVILSGLLILTNGLVSAGLLLIFGTLMLFLGRHYSKDVYLHARYRRWICHSVKSYQKRFLSSIPDYEPHRTITLSLMFIEDRSRPKLTRWVEYAKGTVQGTVHSYGIMQVQSLEKLNDDRSVSKAGELIIKYLAGKKAPLSRRELKKLAKQWNGSIDYTDLLDYVYSVILKLNTEER